MQRLFITGDKHGDFDFLSYFCQENNTTKDDVLIILGDAGILYYGDKSPKEIALKTYISKQPITLLCVRGNHEARPSERDSIKAAFHEDWNETVYFDKNYPNILYAVDGGEYVINGKFILTIGGAYSVDKEYRKIMGWYWNPTEQLSQVERNAIECITEDCHYDYVLTHTCPYEDMPTYLFLKNIDQSKVDNTMELWLQKIKEQITFNHWYYGHYHDDRDFDNNMTILYNEIRELK